MPLTRTEPRHGLNCGTCADGGGTKDSRCVGKRKTIALLANIQDSVAF